MYIIGGKYKRRSLVAPKSTAVRPTTSQLREALFNICKHHIEGAYFLDLFAGSGAIGLEALSRGAAHITFVESHRQAQAAIRKNIENLRVEKETTLLACDVFKALARFPPQSFDLIYADPPYGEGLSAPVLAFIDQHPILKPGGLLFIEDATLQEPPLSRLIQLSQRKLGRGQLIEYGFQSDGARGAPR